MTGDLGQYGVKSPWAHDGVGVAFGADYRREALVDTFDEEFLTGDLAGQGGPKVDVNGSYAVAELFTEARVPIVQDVPFVKNLTADLGYRFSQYTQAGQPRLSKSRVIGRSTTISVFAAAITAL